MLAAMVERWPSLASGHLLQEVFGRLGSEINLEDKMRLLVLLEKLTARCGHHFGSALDANTSQYASVFKSVLSKNPKHGFGSGSEGGFAEKILALTRAWGPVSPKWKEGPYLDLKKVGLSEASKLDAEIKSANKTLDNVGLDDDKEAKKGEEPSQDFEPSVVSLGAPSSLKHFLLESHKDCVFLEAVNSGKKDYEAAIWKVVDKVMENAERSKRQIPDLLAKYRAEKNLQSVVDVLSLLDGELSKALRMDKSGPAKAADDRVDLGDEASYVFNRLAPLCGNYFTSSFGIPISKLVNSRHASLSNKPLALLDLTEHGSAKDSVVFNSTGMFFGKSKSLTYKELCESKVELEGRTLSIGGEAIKFVDEGDARALRTIIDGLQSSMSFFRDTNTPSQQKKKKEEAKREESDSDSESDEEPEEKETPKKEEAAPPQQQEGNLIDLDGL